MSIEYSLKELHDMLEAYQGFVCNGIEITSPVHRAAPELCRQLIKLLEGKGEKPTLFPMQDGPPLDWSTARRVYAMYSRLYGTGQSLERLAQRGGFGWAEVAVITKEYKRKYRDEPA